MKTPSGIKVNLGRERGGENNADSSGQKVPHVTPEGSTHTSLGTIFICILYVIMSLCKEENEDQKYWSSIPSLTARPYRTTAKPWLIMQNCCDYFGINIAKLSLNFSLTLLS
jgi:hypothetical protein